jgi:polyphosphate kinase 2 (PPK2 family)
MLRETSTGAAPWSIVEGEDAHYRGLTVGKAIVEALRRRLDEAVPPAVEPKAQPERPAYAKKNILDALDLTKAVSEKTYDKRLEKLHRDLNLLARHPKFHDRAVVIAYEGTDAAGKGGSIRRVTAALDARQYRVIPVAAPTAEEKQQPYLWRFWRDLPRKKQFTIFDRTWYGRVLVERVEKFCSESAYMRAYGEINDFEEQLVESGTVVVKLWLQISKEEQKKRFDERQKTGFKRYKITDEDWRNRKKWDDYKIAICDMIERTSTDIAPWTLVESNDKYFARLKALETIIARLEEAL